MTADGSPRRADLRLQAVHSDELSDEEFGDLTALCEAAFSQPFARVWERLGPGVHVIGSVDRRPVAHAMIVDRPLYLGHEADQALDAGYVENVATLPQAQGRGYGAGVMREVNRLLDDEYALGALATGSTPFFQRLGWEAWRGPTWVRMADGQRVRTADADGHVMVLRTRGTPPSLDPASELSVDWRADEPW